MKYTDVVKLLYKKASATLDAISALDQAMSAEAVADAIASGGGLRAARSAIYKQRNPAYGVRSPLGDRDYQQIAQQIWNQGDAQRAGLTYDDVLNQVRAKGAGYRQNALSQQQTAAAEASGLMRAHPGLTREDAERLVSEQANRLAGMGYQFAPNPENYDFSDTAIYVPNNRFQRQMNSMNAAAEEATQQQVQQGQRAAANVLGRNVLSDAEAAQIVQIVQQNQARQEAARRQQQAADEAAYNEFRKTLPVGNTAITQTLAPGSQINVVSQHAAPSVAGRPTKAHEDAMGAARVQIKAEDQAFQNGTLPTRGSGSSGTVAYGQPIQRDAKTGVTVQQPAPGARVVRQSRIGNQVFDHYANGKQSLNTEMSAAYARGERPALMKQQPVKRPKPTGNVRNVAPPKTQFK